ncbi:MAG TPA: hypothetical protein VNW47_14815 [Terriglobales bacterium]|jgi:hypothetical protein|nr:hypothetical protein [Terriglobales bacterium]
MRHLASLACTGLLLFAATIVRAQDPFEAFPHFSAIMHSGVFRMEPHQVYRLGSQMRADFETEYRITDLPDRRSWVVRPKTCSHTRLPDISTYPFYTYTAKDFTSERSPTEEKETIEGHTCKIENIVFKPKNGLKIEIKVKLWEAEDLQNFPLKIEISPTDRATTTIKYSNVSLEPPDKKLFQLPKTCLSATAKPSQPKKAPTAPPKAGTPSPTTPH